MTPAAADDFGRHVRTLVASWAAFASAAGGRLHTGPGWVVCLHPNPELNNALLLRADPKALLEIKVHLRAAPTWAIWTSTPASAALVVGMGLSPTERTTPMAAHMERLPRPEALGSATEVGIDPDADPALVCALNGLPPAFASGVPGIRAVATLDGAAGLLMFRCEDDINLSLVATRPEHRRRGRATALVWQTLLFARAAGCGSATLQATPMGARLYERVGFHRVGGWQEWRAGTPGGSCLNR